jgi:hypothetical protein
MANPQNPNPSGAPTSVDQQIYLELKSMNTILSAIAQAIGQVNLTLQMIHAKTK